MPVKNDKVVIQRRKHKPRERLTFKNVGGAGAVSLGVFTAVERAFINGVLARIDEHHKGRNPKRRREEVSLELVRAAAIKLGIALETLDETESGNDNGDSRQLHIPTGDDPTEEESEDDADDDPREDPPEEIPDEVAEKENDRSQSILPKNLSLGENDSDESEPDNESGSSVQWEETGS